MSLSKETVQYVADLSRLALAPQELEKLSRQLQAILDFIDQLKEVDISGVEPTSHILPVSNIFREDAPSPCLSIGETLANAPEKEGNFFVVPKVIE
jgi:aspartyl-tRNA(Asn)/glutamyl-tRNA(Gln) amidotransferase subunit C